MRLLYEFKVVLTFVCMLLLFVLFITSPLFLYIVSFLSNLDDAAFQHAII